MDYMIKASLIHTDVDLQEITASPIQGEDESNSKRLNVAFNMKCLLLFVPKARNLNVAFQLNTHIPLLTM